MLVFFYDPDLHSKQNEMGTKQSRRVMDQMTLETQHARAP